MPAGHINLDVCTLPSSCVLLPRRVCCCQPAAAPIAAAAAAVAAGMVAGPDWAMRGVVLAVAVPCVAAVLGAAGAGCVGSFSCSAHTCPQTAATS